MINTILQKIRQLAAPVLATVMQGSGTAALYLCSSTFLAMLLTALYVSFAWDIDKERWYRAFAVLQGIEDDEAQEEVRNRIIDTSFEQMLDRRAVRGLSDEYQAVRQQIVDLPLPPPEEPVAAAPPPAPSSADRINAYLKRVKDDLAKSQSAGLDDLTDIIGNADPDWAKEVIRKFWKDGQNKRVLQMFAAMEDRERKRILYTMMVDDTDELKDLCEILLKIGDGEPMSSIINNAAEEPE